jgi:hypothetical protein
MHSQSYGEEVDAETLITHMLEMFMLRDREFDHGAPSHSTSEDA